MADDQTPNNSEEQTNEVKEIETIGSVLKRHREEKNLTLRNIADQTKINFTLLENLENDNFDALPKHAYIVGFVKAYSKIICLKENDALELLEHTYNLLYPENVSSKEKSPQKKTSSGPNKTYIIYALIVGLLIAIIGGAIVILKTSQTRTKSTPNISIVEEDEKLSPTPAPKATVKAQPTPTVIFSPTPEPTSTPIPTPTPTPTPKPTPKPKEKKPEEITLKPLPKNLYKITGKQNAELPLVEGKQNLYIIADKGETWVTIKVDEDPVRKFILRKDKRFKTDGDIIRLFFGNINATSIFLNQYLLEAKSRSGVKSLVIPQDQASNYKLPLFIYKKSGQVITSDEIGD